MVAQEEPPLAGGRDGRGVGEDVHDGQALLQAQGHVEARHEREVEGHVKLVALAEVGAHVFRPLVGLGEEDAVAAVLAVDDPAELAEHGVGLGKVLAGGAFPLDEVGHGVAAEAVEPLVEPEAHHLQHGLADGGIVVVEVGLVAEEAMPVVGLPERIPGPVGLLGIDEDDARVAVALLGLAPHVVVGERRGRGAPGGLKPRMLIGGVVHDEIGDDPEAPRVGGVEERAELGHRPVRGMERVEIGDVVPVVAQGGGVHGQEPQAVDAEIPQVVEPGGEAGEVADPIAVAVHEGLDVDLVEDGVLVPVQGPRGAHRQRSLR